MRGMEAILGLCRLQAKADKEVMPFNKGSGMVRHCFEVIRALKQKGAKGG
jgi:hypothetical protein